MVIDNVIAPKAGGNEDRRHPTGLALLYDPVGVLTNHVDSGLGAAPPGESNSGHFPKARPGHA